MQRHTISLAKRAHLFLKIPLRVVRLLFVDIPHQRAEIRRADGKQTITTLPCEGGHTLLLHPNRRGCLQLGNNPRCGSGRSQSQRKMHMVRNAAGAKTFAVELAGCPRKISVQGRCDVLGNQRRAIFGTEYDMDEIQSQRLRHGGMDASGLQPSFLSATPILGLRPRLLCGRAFGPKDTYS